LLYQQSNLSDSTLYQQVINSIPRSEIHYYGALGGGDYSYEVEGCGGGVTTYHHTYGGLVGGVEKIKVINEDRTNYLGIKGSIYNDVWSETRSDEPGSQAFKETYWSLHIYRNLDFKWVGIGGGISGQTGNSIDDELNYVFPNAYLRLGRPIFYIEGGLGERFDIRPDPVTFHLNLGFEGEKGGRSRIGLLNLGVVPGYFFSFSNRTKSGISYEPMFIIGDGFGFNLKFDFSPD